MVPILPYVVGGWCAFYGHGSLKIPQLINPNPRHLLSVSRYAPQEPQLSSLFGFPRAAIINPPIHWNLGCWEFRGTSVCPERKKNGTVEQDLFIDLFANIFFSQHYEKGDKTCSLTQVTTCLRGA
jgi:hypothetical protein